MDVVIERLNLKARALVNLCTSITGAIVLLLISLYAALYAWDAGQRGVHTITPLEFPTAPLIAIVSVGCFMLSIQFLRDSYTCLTTIRELKSQNRKM
jgi:TRAP-type C4-dicarboxylate transport system permease small subunit